MDIIFSEEDKNGIEWEPTPRLRWVVRSAHGNRTLQQMWIRADGIHVCEWRVLQTERLTDNEHS